MKIFFVVVVFALGMAAVGGVNTLFSHTNEMDFCTSCHSMKTNLEEYQETVHFKNASGVRATCADCHVPKSFFPKLAAKVLAVKDVYHELIGTIDSKEKFDAHRWDMANRVWAKMKASDSRECRSCHAFDSMDLSAQDRNARKKHPRARMEGKTCIDCHQGIAHIQPDEPDLEGVDGAKPAMETTN
ncbi:MAG: NapC/NirT family cytochrome c [Gammaproteobacteria bacterium]|nr:NapC/NirT family cytochrome c [Gammaproteobacteria bacterium]MBU1653751.1 NapC/NirT family cytochrome c [Gammaproteobacteria bacterium]MBU1962534.1 NapC/NirT family cytochrome c [Gammaproteobacteria bacterium]